jgi:beta-glucosidase
VDFKITPEALSFWDAQMKRTVEPGEFEILVGPNSVDLKSAVLTVAAGSEFKSAGLARVARQFAH